MSRSQRSVRQPSSRVEDLVEAVVAGRQRLHALPDDLTPEEAAAVRRQALERLRNVALDHLGHYSIDAARASARHCENFIGVTQVPVGIIGPLAVRGDHVRPDEELYVPLATTEGALIASTNRGCRALREAGGAAVRAEDVGMTRAPVFRTGGVEKARRFLAWVEENEERIRAAAERGSRHLKLAAIRPKVLGTSTYLRFRFHTGDAMGMNMATIACDRVARELIEPETGCPCVALSGNFCVDKKAAAVNFLEGRGKRVFAEVVLEREVLESCLKTSAEDLVEVQYRKNLLGSIAAGAMGFNAHYANILAAFFIATGQDVAQVVEGAMGVTTIEARGDGGVVAGVYLPDLPLGVVGGGTALDSQRQALSLLAVEPDPQHPGRAVLRLAEILGATVLAGEISLLAALTEHHLAEAHERLGRGPIPRP